MLTRLKISGFKNLVDVDVPFGPFTCVAGGNGVGKSNLFDALELLAALADKPLLEAAQSVRSEGGVAGDINGIFHHIGEVYADEMTFEVEMLVPPTGVDDLGQPAKAAITFLRYSLTLGRRQEEGSTSSSGLEVRKEELVHIKLGDAKGHLPFPHGPKWRRSVVNGRRTSPFISTETTNQTLYIKLHQDGGKTGRTRLFLAQSLPRTVLSSANASESPTALLARREMQSWRLLQLEPSALRSPDRYNAPSRVATNGAHLPATLNRLAKARKGQAPAQAERVYARVANRLAELFEGVQAVRIEADDRRELYSLIVTDRDGTEHEARALSDGTLRFLALAVLENDPEAQGLLCLEEPENGIHPERIPAMLKLLQDLAVDVDNPVGSDNPLRQVIINTHSPAVVGLLPAESLIYAAAEPRVQPGKRFSAASFHWLDGTWRAQSQPKLRTVSKGLLLSYLNPLGVQDARREFSTANLEQPPSRRRVIDRPDLQLLLPFPSQDLSV